jgi:hypothetical protein
VIATFIDLILNALGFALDATGEEKRDTMGAWLLLAAAITVFAGVVIAVFATTAGHS